MHIYIHLLLLKSHILTALQSSPTISTGGFQKNPYFDMKIHPENSAIFEAKMRVRADKKTEISYIVS